MDSPSLELKESTTIPHLIPVLGKHNRGLTYKSKPNISTPLSQMRDMQTDVFCEFKQAKGKPAVLFTLARAYVLLQECIRVTRGIPSPGQLRPDLDPVQMARMLKRARKRQPIDVPSDIAAALKKTGKKSWSESPRDESPIEPTKDTLTSDATPSETPT